MKKPSPEQIGIMDAMRDGWQLCLYLTPMGKGFRLERAGESQKQRTDIIHAMLRRRRIAYGSREGQIQRFDLLPPEPPNVKPAKIKREPVNEEPKKDKKTMDRRGLTWPKAALEALELNKDLNEFRMKIGYLKEKAISFSDTALRTHIDWMELANLLEKIRKACIRGKPDYVCPYCEGTGSAGERNDCRPCKGQGWVPEHVWKDSPAGHDVDG